MPSHPGRNVLLHGVVLRMRNGSMLSLLELTSLVVEIRRTFYISRGHIASSLSCNPELSCMEDKRRANDIFSHDRWSLVLSLEVGVAEVGMENDRQR